MSELKTCSCPPGECLRPLDGDWNSCKARLAYGLPKDTKKLQEEALIEWRKFVKRMEGVA